MRRWQALLGIGVALLVLWGGNGFVWAQDIPTFDVNPQRTRTVSSTAYTTTYLNPQPFYATVPADPNGGTWQSFSTPVVVGSNLYQYAFDSKGYAVLWQFPMIQPPSSCWAGGIPCIVNWTPTHTWNWDPGFVDGVNTADDIAAPTFSDGYVAMGVGQYLYAWPQSHPAAMAQQYVQGNRHQNIFQIACSPLITPPVRWTGRVLSTGQPTSWSSSAAVVGSWDGGLVSYPVSVPSGVVYNAVHYQTSEDFHHNGSFTTSSPTWDPAIGEVLFGISTPGTLPTYHPRVVAMNPATGAHQLWGVGQIRDSVDVSAAYDGANGLVYVPDQAGNVYAFNGSTGALVAEQNSLSSNSWDISDLAVSPYAVYAVGNGLTDLASLNLHSLSVNWVDHNLGVGMYSPSVVTNGQTDMIFVTSTSGGIHVLTQRGQIIQGIGSPTPEYVSTAADAGPNHWVATWTDADPNGQPAIQVWPTAGFSLSATLSRNAVLPGQQVTLTANPSPPTVVAPNGVTATIPTANGASTTTETVPQENATTWSGAFNAPTTPGTYTVTVTAQTNANSGLSQNSAQTLTKTLSLQVVCDTPDPPSNPQSTLTLPSYSKPGYQDPEPAGDTKLGDTVVGTLSINASSLTPTCVQDAVVKSATLIQATLQHPNGVTAFTSLGNSVTVTADEPMVVAGLTASAAFLENYAGFPPPPTGQVTETDTLTANWTAEVTFTYQIPSGNSWATAIGHYTVPGVASAPLTVIGTDWYVIPLPVAGTDQFGP